MSPPQNPNSGRKQGGDKSQQLQDEVKAARRAAREGRYQEAQHHLSRAEHLGASPAQISALSQAMRGGHKDLQQRFRSSRRWGFWCGLFGYLLVSMQQPLGWGMGLWILFAFVLVPGLIALVVTWRQGIGSLGRTRFWVAFRAACITMTLYTGISLLIVGERLGGDAAGASGRLLAGVLTIVFFAILAGTAAGLLSLLFGYRPLKEGTHEPAS